MKKVMQDGTVISRPITSHTLVVFENTDDSRRDYYTVIDACVFARKRFGGEAVYEVYALGEHNRWGDETSYQVFTIPSGAKYFTYESMEKIVAGYRCDRHNPLFVEHKHQMGSTYDDLALYLWEELEIEDDKLEYFTREELDAI